MRSHYEGMKRLLIISIVEKNVLEALDTILNLQHIRGRTLGSMIKV